MAIPKNLLREEQIMFPLKQGGHSVDAYIVSAASHADIKARNMMAVLQADDPHIVTRGIIVRKKQLENSNNKLKTFLNIQGK